MIEHLNNPGLFLEGIKRFMNDKTLLVITTINAYCGMRFWIYGLRGKKGSVEPVHPDHVAYYSYSTLGLLLARHDLQTEKFMFYDLGKEHRQHNRWILNFINDVCVSIAPQWADGIIAVCRVAVTKAQPLKSGMAEEMKKTIRQAHHHRFSEGYSISRRRDSPCFRFAYLVIARGRNRLDDNKPVAAPDTRVRLFGRLPVFCNFRDFAFILDGLRPKRPGATPNRWNSFRFGNGGSGGYTRRISSR